MLGADQTSGGRCLGGDWGFTLVEVVVAALCTTLLLHFALSAQIRIANAVRVELVSLDAGSSLRTARAVVREETLWTAPGIDWVWPGSDSLRLRAMRGVANACDDGSGLFAYEGLREPNPAKDSVLVMRPDGRWLPSRLARSERRGVCYEWLLDPEVSDALLVLLFESGSYHLVDGSLRYRTGRGGRQPITGPIGGVPEFMWSGASMGVVDTDRRGR